MISNIIDMGKALFQGVKAAMVTKDIIIDVKDNPSERIESFSQGEGLGAFVSMPDDPKEVKSLMQQEQSVASKFLNKVSSVFLNKFTKPLVDFISSPTIVRVATLASAGILAGGVLIGGGIATGGLLPVLTIAAAGVSVAATAAGVMMDARRAQKTHYIRAENQAVANINLYTKLIEQRIENIKAINPEIAEYLRGHAGLLIKRQNDPEQIINKPKVINSILKTLQDKAPEGTSSFMTALTAIPSGPIGIATAAISGVGMLAGYEHNSRIRYAIDIQSKQIKDMTDNTLSSMGLNISSFQGKERLLMVTEVRNVLLAADRALSTVSQALKDGKVTTKEEAYTFFAQAKHEEYNSIIKEEHKIVGTNVPSFRRCIGEVLTEGLSSYKAAAMFVPKRNIVNTDVTESRESQRYSHLKHVEKVTELYKAHNPLLNKLRTCSSEPSLSTLHLDEEGSVKHGLRRIESDPVLANMRHDHSSTSTGINTEIQTMMIDNISHKAKNIDASVDKTTNTTTAEHRKYVDLIQEEGRQQHRAIGRG